MLVPQIVGGVVPVGFVTLNVSTVHCPWFATKTRFAAGGVSKAKAPERGWRRLTHVLVVLGPVIWKLTKSRRILKKIVNSSVYTCIRVFFFTWQMSSPHGQISTWHFPAVGVSLSK